MIYSHRELESRRRSIAMLEPEAMAMRREEAMRLLAELEDLQGRLRRMREGLRTILHDAESEAKH